MEKVLTDQLILHPAPISPPVIVKSGIVTKSNFFAGVPYWVIQQPIAIPELSITIDFIVVVIELKQKNQYIIQSLNMSIKNSSPM